MIGDNARRIKKLEKVKELMDHMIVTPTVNGRQLAQEELIAIILGVREGFAAAKAVAGGECDDMGAIEVATRAYETAFGLYIEGVVLAEDKPAEQECASDSEAEHGDE